MHERRCKKNPTKAFLLYNKPNAREGMYNMTFMRENRQNKIQLAHGQSINDPFLLCMYGICIHLGSSLSSLGVGLLLLGCSLATVAVDVLQELIDTSIVVGTIGSSGGGGLFDALAD